MKFSPGTSLPSTSQNTEGAGRPFLEKLVDDDVVVVVVVFSLLSFRLLFSVLLSSVPGLTVVVRLSERFPRV